MLRLPDEFQDTVVLSSPLVRAVETARIICGREPVIAPALIEMDWGRFEGRRGVDLLEDSNSGYRHIEEWGWGFQPPEGETPRTVWQRLEPWLATFRGRAVVVTHIGVMRVLLARATGWNFEGPPPFRVKRDRLYRLQVDDKGTLSHDDDPVRLMTAAKS